MPEAGLKIAQKALKTRFFVNILPRHLVWLGSVGYFVFGGGLTPQTPPPTPTFGSFRLKNNIDSLSLLHFRLSTFPPGFPLSVKINLATRLDLLLAFSNGILKIFWNDLKTKINSSILYAKRRNVCLKNTLFDWIYVSIN